MSKVTKHSEFERNCPECNDVLYYSSKRNLQRAIGNNNVCRSCRKMPKLMKDSLSEYWIGRKRLNYPKHRKVTVHSEWYRNCELCNKKIYYKSEYNRNLAETKNSVCNSCSTYKYKKTWEYRITDEHTKQMRATKAGYDTFEEYMEDLPEKKKYHRYVWRITYQQDLESFENYDKRGRCGVEGAYQIDHIISIDEGYRSDIPPEKIGDISNLQMLTWEDNLSKSNK
jgi:hypothetical protein